MSSSPIVTKPEPRIEQTRVTYHALLMRYIEAHKHYPRVARKRRIQGKILVSFSLLKNVTIKNLLINGKKSILKKPLNKQLIVLCLCHTSERIITSSGS